MVCNRRRIGEGPAKSRSFPPGQPKSASTRKAAIIIQAPTSSTACWFRFAEKPGAPSKGAASLRAFGAQTTMGARPAPTTETGFGPWGTFLATATRPPFVGSRSALTGAPTRPEIGPVASRTGERSVPLFWRSLFWRPLIWAPVVWAPPSRDGDPERVTRLGFWKGSDRWRANIMETSVRLKFATG